MVDVVLRVVGEPERSMTLRERSLPTVVKETTSWSPSSSKANASAARAASVA